MSDTTTPNYGFTLPSIGASQDTWGNKLNANWAEADSVIYSLASGYLPISGGTLSGGLVISPASGTALLNLNKPAGTVTNSADIYGTTAGTLRWLLRLSTLEAESGSNAGSNFGIYRYDDLGNYLGNPLSISRATGNVAIAQALSVAGAVSAPSASFSGAMSASSASLSGQVTANSFMNTGGTFYVGGNLNYYLARTQSDGAWRIAENGTVNLTIDTGGNLTARGAIFGTNAQFSGGLNVNNMAMARFGSGSMLSFWPGGFDLSFSRDGTESLVYTSGSNDHFIARPADWLFYNNIGSFAGHGDYANISDGRSKREIEPASRGLAEILRLRPVSFQRIRHRADTRPLRTELGFVAQDVAQVIPEAVEAVGMELFDGSGRLDSDEPSLALTTTPIVATLVNAVKQLAARVAALEAHSA
jgi:hypothetical protein